MSNHKNLIWFNKEGDYLNFNYNNSNDRFEGDILFHESSTDVYKTYGLYMFEEVPSFEFERPNELTTRKFQLFNEMGIHFYGSEYKYQKISKIEPVNNDVNFYSKWIYGNNFESKFPIGTIVSFDTSLLEFNNPNKTYVVTGNKKNAILILSIVDNKTFELDYQNEYENNDTYTNKTLSGVNSIGVYDYVDIETYEEKLSVWNEPNFYDKYFIGKKLNIVNSESNDNTVTVNNNNLIDISHFEYFLNKNDLPTNSDIIIEIISKTDLPRIYNGEIIIDNNRININPNFYPNILKPGTEFKIVRSVNNNIFLRVSNIPNWNGIVTSTDFKENDQIIYNNKIYQCQEDYTQSFSNISTSSITPENSDKWGKPDYISVEQNLTSDNISLGQLYLTTDKFYFTYQWDTNKEITLASAVDKYKNTLNLFNIDLFYENEMIKADLIYPSEYAIINFYHSEFNQNNKIGSFNKTIERIVGVEENLNYELNYDISKQFDFKIVFTDIDDYGIKVNINGMVYEEEVAFIFSGNSVDMERTIDRTLRNWLIRNYIELHKLGINVELRFSGNYTSLFYNSIRIISQYPNVPVDVEEVLVGTTANYYIEHSKVLFRNLGSFLNIRINDVDYGIETVYNNNTNIPNISLTLNNWVSQYKNQLNRFNIEVKNINELLVFNIKELERRLDYQITTGKVNIPGLKDFIITDFLKGNEGVIISSNEILLPKERDENLEHFEEAGFATGMGVSINNTMYSLVNQEYNIQYLDPLIMNISYEGPFWGLTSSICNSSAFVTLAFNSGFGLTGCNEPLNLENNATSPFGEGLDIRPGNGEELSIGETPSGEFELNYNNNEYEVTEFNLSNLSGSQNIVDILYVQLSDSIYTLADSLIVHDATTSNYKNIIPLVNNNGSVKLKYNNINNYLYALTENNIYIINPLSDIIVDVIDFQNSENAFDIDFNPINGDIYVTFNNFNKISIWSVSNYSNVPSKDISTINNTKNIVFNSFEQDMYVSTEGGYILRINSNRTVQQIYNISNEISGSDEIISKLFYEPVNESIYFYTNNYLAKIDNGEVFSINPSSNSFNEMIFNNLTGDLNISSGSLNNGNFIKLDISNDSRQSYNIDNYGFLGLNQFDGSLYLSSQILDSILVINPINGEILYNQNLTSGATKIINNPQRNSMWAIQPDNRIIIEMVVELNSTITPLEENSEIVGENLYGTLDSDYLKRDSIWLKTKNYIRKPRENFKGDVQTELYWKWENDQSPEFFIYDFSGEQLQDNGVYTYTGIKPLDKIVLNKKPNKDINRISQPEYQQTIFDKLTYKLPFIDDQSETSDEVKPLELFLGYKSEAEGTYTSVLKLYKKEEVKFEILTDELTNITFETIEDNDRRGIIYLNQTSSASFLNKGLKAEQLLVLYLNDITNETNQYTSNNNASIFKIREVFSKSIILDFINNGDFLEEENTVINDYPNNGDITLLSTTFKVSDKEIGRFNVYGQTEDEDERFRINLGNEGKLIGPDEIFIFKQYDIQEGGIDWTFLNKKRKEMLMMKQLIYPYIGAYKSIINAINFFGYNDLQLNEYYKNINIDSENFSKLFKVEIPDLFDNSTEGWEENDFIKNTYPNENYEETKLFNLTYKITDKEGNKVINYSLDEIIIKLQGLKYWLKNNIIPLTHKIEDITGEAYIKTSNYIQHRLHDIRIINIKENMTPISVKMNEVYLMPINSGSTVYNCMLDFYSIIEDIGKNDLTTDTKPFNGFSLSLPDTFDIKIRTYKTYKEWIPFETYNKGDKVRYLDFLYESVIDYNRTNKPNKYNSAPNWSPNIRYESASIVLYEDNYYSLRKESLISSTPPSIDSNNWFKISQWVRIDFESVQTITEFRKGNDLLPYNFTIDSNIDPFITIEVTSDNGYGEIYRDKKNYELKGRDDLGLMSVNEIDNLPTLKSPIN